MLKYLITKIARNLLREREEKGFIHGYVDKLVYLRVHVWNSNLSYCFVYVSQIGREIV